MDQLAAPTEIDIFLLIRRRFPAYSQSLERLIAYCGTRYGHYASREAIEKFLDRASGSVPLPQDVQDELAQRGFVTNRARWLMTRFLRSVADYRKEIASLSVEDVRNHVGEFSDLLEDPPSLAPEWSIEQDQDADCDYDYWMTLPFWTAAEASAISLGKDPSVINPDSLGQYLANGSPFKKVFDRRLQLIDRAIGAQQMCERPSPKAFLRWAAERKIELPSPLHQFVFGARKAATASGGAEGAEEDQLPPRARRSLLAMVLGMAIARYEYDTTAARSDTSGTIADEVRFVGLNIDRNTVRTWLRHADEYFHYEQKNKFLCPVKGIRLREAYLGDRKPN